MSLVVGRLSDLKTPFRVTDVVTFRVLTPPLFFSGGQPSWALPVRGPLSSGVWNKLEVEKEVRQAHCVASPAPNFCGHVSDSPTKRAPSCGGSRLAHLGPRHEKPLLGG